MTMDIKTTTMTKYNITNTFKKICAITVTTAPATVSVASYSLLHCYYFF